MACRNDGFAAAQGHLSTEAWVLFAILFLWQFPHFHAIAWMYRDDYRRGGNKMLAVVNPDAIASRVLSTLSLLLLVSLLPGLLDMAGLTYLCSAALLGSGFMYFGWRMCRHKTHATARHVLLASVIYLQLLFAVLILDKPH